MRNYRIYIAMLSILIVSGQKSEVFGQQFGQNKVQYHNLTWQYIQTPNFDVYYTDGGREIAEFTAKEAEEAYRYIAEDFRWTLPEGDRISIIAYNSHNDFEQTNVMGGPVGEGTQGFTEFFKNRVVLPYTGSWEDYRHTVHHEITHALTLYMQYGSGVMSILEGLSRTRVPLWFIEGLAEYESLFGMDTESEMYIRDLVVNSRLPEIDQLDYYGYVGVYKCGQSVLHFIAETYGEEKIGELLHKLKGSRDAHRAVKATLGIDWEEFNRRWQKFVNRYHWPIGAVTDQPVDIAEKITDHSEKEYNYYDISPAISPQGDKLVYISNRSDYFDVYLYSLVEGKRIKKLVSGERSKDFEELHIIRPGISWSPDSKKIVLASKSGGYDVLNIVDVIEGKVERTITFEMDGMFSPSWSPSGGKIAFTGIVDGQSDLYIVNLADGSLIKVTDDVFSDLDPSWSLDGSAILFSSDRQDYLDPSYLPPDFDIYNFDYNNFDIYSASVAKNYKLTRITTDPSWDRTPVFGPDSTIFYTSDENGIFNLYRKNLITEETTAITNIVTGVLQPSISRDGQKLAFVALYDFGYDIYLMTDPMAPSLKKELALTPLKKKLLAQEPRDIPELYKEDYKLPREKNEARPYKNFVFDYRRRDSSSSEKTDIPDTTTFKTESGDYVEKDYSVRLSADYVYANAYFSSIWGARGVAVAHFSDVFGDHNITLLTDLQNRIEVSNYLIGYQYLPKRIDFSISLYHLMYFFYTNQPNYSGISYDPRTYFRDRYYGAAVSAHYPFSKFRRLEWNIDLLAIDRGVWDNFWDEYKLASQSRLWINEFAFVKDNSVWRYFGPMNGGRYRLSITASPNLYPDSTPYSSGKTGLDYYLAEGDFRKYIKAGFDYSFIFRLAGGAAFSEHDNARFFLGGIDNWINRSFYTPLQETDVQDIYVSKFVTPLRGTGLYELIGNRYILFNSEFRFPFIQYLIFGWPIPYPFINIRGALFMDFGAAWNNGLDSFDLYSNGELQDAVMGIGFGMRFPFPFIGWPTKWDVAWKTDFDGITRPRYYLSLGYEL